MSAYNITKRLVNPIKPKDSNYCQKIFETEVIIGPSDNSSKNNFVLFFIIFDTSASFYS